MKTLISMRLALAGTVALFTHTTFAQTWQTVDDFQVVSNHVAEPLAMAVDAQGSIYAAGMYENGVGGYKNALVRRSSDQGASWTTIEDYTYPNPTNHVVAFTAIGLDLAQNLYAVGLTGLGGGDATDRLVVRKSADGGATWATSLDVAAPKALNGTATIGSPAFVADAAGAIYVSVIYSAGSFILKSTDAGATWISWNAGAWVRGMASAPTGLFAAEAAGSPWGAVKKSLNGGTTWTTVDSYTPSGFNSTFCYGGQSGGVEALCLDGQANLYLGGDAFITVTSGKGRHVTSTTTYNWVIRKGSNGGVTWNTVALFPIGSTTTCFVNHLNGLGADPAGNVYAVGQVNDSTGYHRWIVEKGANQGTSWTLVDNYGPYGPLFTALATAVACDAAGGVYVCGAALLPGGTQGHWVVRKQVGP